MTSVSEIIVEKVLSKISRPKCVNAEHGVYPF